MDLEQTALHRVMESHANHSPFVARWSRNVYLAFCSEWCCSLAEKLIREPWLNFVSVWDISNGAEASGWLCSSPAAKVSSVSQDCGRIDSFVKHIGRREGYGGHIYWCSPSLVLFRNLLRMHFILSPRSLKMTLIGIGSHIYLWRTAVVN